MPDKSKPEEKAVYRLSSHRRTITETDIVNFVNLAGLHEPPFIDMEFVGSLPESHNRRFAPAPLLISLGMGLVATRIMPDIIEKMAASEHLGAFHGMIGVEAAVRSPVYPGDTLFVELEARVDRKTSKGQTIVALHHTMKNQENEVVVVFTEKVIFEAGP
jgi:acyl dehydratase